jgi:hypothetical protein
MYITHYSCQILIKFEFFDRFSKNTQKIKFHEIRSVGARLFHAGGQMDGHV